MTSPSALLFDTYYHIYNRGTNRENLYFEERNYSYFLKLYVKYIEPVAETFAYCLLRNHFHFLVRIRSEEEIKTLRVSLMSSNLSQRGDADNLDESPTDKPLGSRYESHQFSHFFNAYTKAINKAYHRTGSLFQHPFGRVLIKDDCQFWHVIAYIHQNPQKLNS